MPARLPAAGPLPQVNSLIHCLCNFVLCLSLAVERAEPLEDTHSLVSDYLRNSALVRFGPCPAISTSKSIFAIMSSDWTSSVQLPPSA